MIYLFGFKTAFSAGPEYLAALNIVGLCTDAQWDMLEAITTVAEVDISKKRFDYKKHVKNAYIYLAVVILTSVIMTVILSAINEVVWSIVIIYLVFQIADMLMSPYKYILSTYTQLEYSATLNTIIKLVLKGLRTLLSIVILSPYCADIGQVVQGGLAFIIYFVIRMVKYKLVDGELVVKSKSEKCHNESKEESK